MPSSSASTPRASPPGAESPWAAPFYNEEHQEPSGPPKAFWRLCSCKLTRQAGGRHPRLRPRAANRMTRPASNSPCGTSSASYGASLAEMLERRARVAVGVAPPPASVSSPTSTLLSPPSMAIWRTATVASSSRIRPGWDIEPVRAVRNAWPNLKLQVGATASTPLRRRAPGWKLRRLRPAPGRTACPRRRHLRPRQAQAAVAHAALPGRKHCLA